MDFITSLPLLQIHITAVFITITLVVIADAHGLAWVLGKIKTLPAKRMHILHSCIWAGLSVIITAGVLMFISYPEYLLSLPAFKIKIAAVALLLVNAFFIGSHVAIASLKTFAELPVQEKRLLLISGGISSVGWLCAYVCAQLLG